MVFVALISDYHTFTIDCLPALAAVLCRGDGFLALGVSDVGLAGDRGSTGFTGPVSLLPMPTVLKLKQILHVHFACPLTISFHQ